MKKIVAIPTLALGVMSAGVQAHEAGEWIVRVGATMVEPREDSGPVTLNGTPLLLGGKGSQLGVDASTQLGLTVNYMLSKTWSVELLAATPFRHDAMGTGALAGLKIADAKQLPPTLSLIYHFPEIGKWQNYVGVGLNHTFFFSEEITGAAAATLGTLGLTGGSLSMDSSTGASLQWGVDYHLDNDWLVNASVRWIDIDTTADIAFSNGSRLTADVEIDPLVYTLAVGFSF